MQRAHLYYKTKQCHLKGCDFLAKYTKRKDGRYCTSVTVGRKDNGKPILKYLYAKSIRELDEKVAKVRVLKESYKPQSDITLGEYAIRWLEVYKTNLASGTYIMYKSRVNKYIIAELGDVPLNQITKGMVQSLVNRHIDKPSACRVVVMILKQILNTAIDEELLDKNVITRIDFPRYDKKEKRALSEFEIKKIFSADLNEKQLTLVKLLYYTGIRIGEALALNWEDIDKANHTVTINKSVSRDKNDLTKCVITYPKTKSSVRVVPYPSFVDFGQGKGSIFNIKTYYEKVHAFSAIKTKLKHVGVTDITPHYFRHNYCTMLYYSGVSLLQAKELLGHSDINQIMKVYAHLDSQKENLQSKIDNIFDNNFDNKTIKNVVKLRKIT